MDLDSLQYGSKANQFEWIIFKVSPHLNLQNLNFQNLFAISNPRICPLYSFLLIFPRSLEDDASWKQSFFKSNLNIVPVNFALF